MDWTNIKAFACLNWKNIVVGFVFGAAIGCGVRAAVLSDELALLVTGFATLASGAIAAGAALWASKLTGDQMARVEREKHCREVEALKVGLVEELTWAVNELHMRAVVSSPTKRNSCWMCTCSRALLPDGTAVFNRASGSIASAGPEFAIAAIRAYAIIKSGNVASDGSIRYFADHMAALLTVLRNLVLLLPEHNQDTKDRAMSVINESTTSLLKVLSGIGKDFVASQRVVDDLNVFLGRVHADGGERLSIVQGDKIPPSAYSSGAGHYWKLERHVAR